MHTARHFLSTAGILLCGTLLCAGLCGCNGTPVGQDLTQQQAREIVAVLHERNIDSTLEKESGGKGKYSVAVPSSSYGAAVSLLHDRKIPSPPKLGLDELLEQKGFLPQSRELEGLKFDHVLATELEGALGALPGVTAAKVIVRSQNQVNGAQGSALGGAVSAIVTYKDVGSQLQAGEIVDIVLRSVPGVAREQIGVVLNQDKSPDATTVASPSTDVVPFLWVTRVPRADYIQLAILITGCVSIIGIAAAIAGYWWGVFYRRAPEMRRMETDRTSRSIRLERLSRNEGDL